VRLSFAPHGFVMILRIAVVLVAALAGTFAPAATAQKFQPGSVYICPNNPDSGLDCYLDAVTHLYTMCRHVKSIEIIEFGYEKAQEGVNGAKSDYCVDKQKVNITRPYQAALREATGWREAVDGLRSLQQFWLDAMASLRWQPGEADEAYQDRVNKIYDELSYKIESVRVGFSTAPDNAPAVQVAKPKGKNPKTAKGS
jgi:hypothetical protein